ncbi:MAG: hypothetical protein H6636_04360 [Anaerolineales bacterium]|nr:hypothetical protein [Anaerolineales bacterium]
MAPISPDLLNDTLSLISLAREAALAKGNQAQADRFAPVAKELHSLVNETRTGSATTANAAPSKPAVSAPPSSTPTGVMAESGFQALLAASQSKSRTVNPLSAALERNQMVAAMGAGGMSDLDIARQMGMTREEVRVVLNIGGFA